MDILFRTITGPVTFVLLMLTLSVSGQIQHGGQPFDIRSGMKAADVVYLLPPPDPFELEAMHRKNEESQLKILNFAIERIVDISPESQGQWIDYKGYRIWRVHIISPEAYSLGTVFEPFRLTGDARIFLYDPDKSKVLGSFTAENNKSSGIFATGHIPGEELIVELQVPWEQEDFGDIRIKSVSHSALQVCPGDFGCSQECEIDINCEEGADWQKVKRSVVRILTTTQYCSGVMLNNTAYDGKPYLITAEHCINSFSLASSAIFYFNYESAECFGADGSLEHSISGSTLKAFGDSIDFSLVELSVSPPVNFDAWYAGWDLTVDQDPGVTTIHYPMGDVKKISFDFDDISIPQSESDIKGGGDLLDYKFFSLWWVHQWDIGSTEAGSSGGPLFNSNKQVIGTLSGGQAACGVKIGVDPETGRDIFSKGVNVNDYFTRIGMSWDYYGEKGPNLKEWLDPINTGQVSIGGYNPSTSGLQPVLHNHPLSLYPNPANGKIFVASDISDTGSIRFSIYDIHGKLLRSVISSGSVNPVEIDLTGILPGIYILRVEGKLLIGSVRFIVE